MANFTSTKTAAKATVKVHTITLAVIGAVATATLLGAFTAQFAIVTMSLVSDSTRSVSIAVTAEDCGFGYKWDGTKCSELIAHATCRVAEGYYDVTKELAGDCSDYVKYNQDLIKNIAENRPECVRYACALVLAQQKGKISADNREKLCMRDISDYGASYANLLDCVDLKNAYSSIFNGKINYLAATRALYNVKNAIVNDDDVLFDSVMKTQFDSYFKTQFRFGKLTAIRGIRAIADDNAFGSWANAEFEFDNPSSDFLPSTMLGESIRYNVKFQPRDIRNLTSGYNIIFMTEKDPALFRPGVSASTATVKQAAVSMSAGSIVSDPCQPINGLVESTDCYNRVFDVHNCFSTKLCDAFGIDPDCDDHARAFCQAAESRGLKCKQYIMQAKFAAGRLVTKENIFGGLGVFTEVKSVDVSHALNLIELRDPGRYCILESQLAGLYGSPFVYGCWSKSQGDEVPSGIQEGIVSILQPPYAGYGYVKDSYREWILSAGSSIFVLQDLVLNCAGIQECITDRVQLCSRNFEYGQRCLLKQGQERCSNSDEKVDHFCSNVDPDIWPWPGWVVIDDWNVWGQCGTFDGGISFSVDHE